MSTGEIFQSWLQERNIVDVEAFVPDMAGSARGKIIPADKFGSGHVVGAGCGEFALHRHILGAIDAMRGILGDDFVTAYTAVKDDEYREFQEIITPYERDILMLNV